MESCRRPPHRTIRHRHPQPCRPEQNGIIERCFRSLKAVCVWPSTFRAFEEEDGSSGTGCTWYNHERPCNALGYRSPVQYRAQQSIVASSPVQTPPHPRRPIPYEIAPSFSPQGHALTSRPIKTPAPFSFPLSFATFLRLRADAPRPVFLSPTFAGRSTRWKLSLGWL